MTSLLLNAAGVFYRIAPLNKRSMKNIHTYRTMNHGPAKTAMIFNSANTVCRIKLFLLLFYREFSIRSTLCSELSGANDVSGKSKYFCIAFVKSLFTGPFLFHYLVL